MALDIKEDFFQKEEWIDTVKYMSPRPQFNHMEIEGAVFVELRKYFNNRCKVAIETSLFLTKENPNDIKNDVLKLKELIKSKKLELVPDIAVYCDRDQIFKRGFLGIPKLVVEVLSPSNSDDDTEKKKEIYRQYGVSEYWIISPMSKTAFVYGLEEENYKLVGEYKFKEEEIASYGFLDLSIDITDVELIDEED